MESMTNKQMTEREERIISRIEELSTLLGGTMTKLTRANSVGRSSKVIEIEYEVKTK